MKTISKLYNLIPLIALLCVGGCSEDSMGLAITYTEPQNITEYFSYTTTDGQDAVVFGDPQQVESYIEFTDTSDGVLKREWTLDGGAQFLPQTIGSGDLASQVSDATSSARPLENIYFSKAGLATVMLKNSFSQNVSNDDDVKAVYNSGSWEVSYPFSVPVFSKTLTPAIQISSLGEVLATVSATGDVNFGGSNLDIVIGKGDEITFESITTEEGFTPEELEGIDSNITTIWSYDGDADFASTGEISFASVGDYKDFKVTIARSNPATTTGELTIPVTLKIVESYVTVTSMNLTTSNQIVLTMSKSMGAVSKSYDSFIGDFTLAVTNDGSAVNDVTISSIATDSEDATKLIFTLSSDLYSDDVVTLAYKSSTGIRTDSDSLLDTFEAQSVTNDIGSVLDVLAEDVFGFEYSVALGDKMTGTVTTSPYWYSSATAYTQVVEDPLNQGNNVVQITGSGAALTINTKNLTGAVVPSISAGSYNVSIKFYIPTGTDVTSNYFAIQTVSGTALLSANAYPVAGSWITVTKELTLATALAGSTTANQGQIKVIFSANSTKLPAGTTIYIDDIEIKPIRP